jgi:hypothetical protein
VINLGDDVRDTITGCTGIATGRTEWLYGCVRIGVQPRVLKEKEPVPVDLQWFDEAQLVVVEASAVQANTGQVSEAPAGPREDCQRAPDPSR